MNEVIARLCTNGFAVVCSNGCPAFEELVSENVSDLGLRKSPNKFDHSKSKPLRSELKFVLHILWQMWNWECGVRSEKAKSQNRRFRFAIRHFAFRKFRVCSDDIRETCARSSENTRYR